MAEYIEREAVKTAVRKRLNNSLIIGWLCRIINDIPAADVAPVVRCRDCINCIDCDGVPYCTHWERNTDNDGYCHEGR